MPARFCKHGEEIDKDSSVMRLSFMNSLQACAKKKDLYEGTRIHADIRYSGLFEKDTYLGNALVSMYAKCGALAKAQQVVEELPTRDVVSWTALIAGYVQHGQGKEALGFYLQMQSESLSPNAITYACILKACGIMRDTDMGKQIHDEIVSQGLLQNDVVLGNALVDMYAKCGVLWKAQKVFDELPIQNVVSWNTLIAGYVQQGQGEEALHYFHRMQCEGPSPSAITYACILKACGMLRDIDMGKQIHDEVVSQELLNKNVVLGNALVDMYAKCDELVKAQKVYDELRVRNAVSWNALIIGYAQQGQRQKALSCFQQMRSEGFSPNKDSWTALIGGYGLAEEALHADIRDCGLLEKDTYLGNTLIDMYVKCGALARAQQVVDELQVRDVISWTTLIAGYVQHGQGKEALHCFQRMQSEGLSPNAITYACILKACGILRDVDMGKQIHYEIFSQGLLEKDVVLGNALVDMYAKWGLLSKAQKVFDGLAVRDAVSWNALIAGYAQQGLGKEALGCFRRMQGEGVSPTVVTYACSLKACGMMQDIDTGKQIHDEIASKQLLEKNVILGNALVDMYAKCGVLLKAQKVFDELRDRNTVSWNALIAGYAQHGQGQQALGCFQRMQGEGHSPNVVSWTALIGGYAQQGLAKEAMYCFQWMQQEGISPNSVTFLNVLNACSRLGLVDQCQMYFDNMREKYGIAPKNKHYTCMVDLFARTRLFDKAMRVIMMMPSFDHPPLWSALLGACQKCGNVKLGRVAFERAVQLDGCNGGAYVLMRSIYAATGTQEVAEKVKCMNMKNATWKQLGNCCWVDGGQSVHMFVVGDNKHPQSRQVYATLEDV